MKYSACVQFKVNAYGSYEGFKVVTGKRIQVCSSQVGCLLYWSMRDVKIVALWFALKKNLPIMPA